MNASRDRWDHALNELLVMSAAAHAHTVYKGRALTLFTIDGGRVIITSPAGAARLESMLTQSRSWEELHDERMPGASARSWRRKNLSQRDLEILVHTKDPTIDPAFPVVVDYDPHIRNSQ